MVILISGASHTGKTNLAQKLLEKYGFPYLSIDHLKMGLIRTGMTSLTPESSDAELTAFLWPIVREMVKTAIENEQNLIVEGCYIPYTWREDFAPEYLAKLRGVCLVMSERYVREHFDRIRAYACIIERRLDDDYLTPETAAAENAEALRRCRESGMDYLLIDDDYNVELELDL